MSKPVPEGPSILQSSALSCPKHTCLEVSSNLKDLDYLVQVCLWGFNAGPPGAGLITPDIVYLFMKLIISTFISEGVQEEYDDVKNVGEYMSDMFGMLLTPSFSLYNDFI